MRKYSPIPKNRKQEVMQVFSTRNPFLLIAIFFLFALTVATPLYITRQQNLQQNAAENSYVSATGAGDLGFFSVSDPVVVDLQRNYVTIIWNTNANSRSMITYWPDNFWYSLFPFLPKSQDYSTELTTEHQIKLTHDISPGKRYAYTITETTDNDEKFTSKYYYFTTPKN